MQKGISKLLLLVTLLCVHELTANPISNCKNMSKDDIVSGFKYLCVIFRPSIFIRPRLGLQAYYFGGKKTILEWT